MSNRRKTDKWDLTEIKTCVQEKRYYYRAKGQPTEWEEIFAKHISRIQIYPTTQQQNNNCKMSTELEQTFLRRRGTHGQQAHEQMLHSLDTREMKGKATVSHTSHY